MSSLIRRFTPLAAIVLLIAMTPLLSGCLTKSVTVGDQFSGVVIVAASSEVGVAPTFDVPASMTGSVRVSEYPSASQQPGGDDPDDGGSTDDGSPEDRSKGKTGSRLTFTDLTAGQFSQLGDIISTALDAGATVDLDASRSEDIVRLRGGASLTGMSENAFYVSITVEFDGPVVSTNGTSAGDNAVTWTPVPGQNVEFTADSKYPDPATAALPSWGLLIAAGCLSIVAAVGLLAYRFRDQSSPRAQAKSSGGNKNSVKANDSDKADAVKK